MKLTLSKASLPKPLRANIRRGKWRQADQAKFFGLLADLTQVGFPMKRALHFAKLMLVGQTLWIQQIEQAVATGQSFSAAIRPLVHSDLYYQLLIAERHGDAQQVWSELSQILRLKVAQRQRLWQVLQYPLMLMGLLVLLIIGLRWIILPQLNALAPTTAPRPFYWYGIFGGVSFLLFSSGVGWRWYRRQNVMTRLALACRMPLIGRFVRQYYAYYLTATLAMLLKNGMTIQDILKLVAHFQPGSLFYELGHRLRQRLDRGQTFEDFIHDYLFIPNQLVLLLSKGRPSQQIGEDFEALGRIEFKHLTTQLKRGVNLVQPMMLLVIGIVIVSVYTSILLPLYHSIGGLMPG